jgi:superfamily II DNA or RNA helicase
MVLIQQTKHGDILHRMFEAKGLRVAFIKGENDQVERKKALNDLATGKIDVLIGTTILDVGVDVPAVGLIVLAGGGKAEVALRQRIGRGLRAKKTGPNIALIVDFNDPFNNYTKQHAAQRLSIIKDTEGFGENIVDVDFDYRAYGFRPKFDTSSI